ncbi:MAG: YARHG domain-containing protein [Chloroflexi bacterium]|nr:YARHG domain-containing protein [Chloroflexota bacterium]
MKSLYNQNNRNGLKVERLVNQGVIRVLGTLSTSSATTGSDGVATVTYQTSHIASDFSQNNRAREKIVATLSNGKQRTLNLNIGWRGLQQIDNVPGGHRVIGARGTRVRPKLRKFLKTLGDAVKGAKWPHPVTVTAASLRRGGQYPSHFTHKKGLTLDLRPMSTDGESTWTKKDSSSDWWAWRFRCFDRNPLGNKFLPESNGLRHVRHHVFTLWCINQVRTAREIMRFGRSERRLLVLLAFLSGLLGTQAVALDLMQERVKEADVKYKTCKELRNMRNEIFARHGREFGNPELRAYFLAQDWYIPKYKPSAFPNEELINDLQYKNIQYIKHFEDEKECREPRAVFDFSQWGIVEWSAAFVGLAALLTIIGMLYRFIAKRPRREQDPLE